MTNQTQAPEAAFTAIPSNPSRKAYTVKEQICGWLSVLAGYFYCRVSTVIDRPFAALLFLFGLFLFGFMFFKGTKMKARRLFYPVSAMVLGLSLFFSGSKLLHFLVYSYGIASFLMYCQTGSNGSLENHASFLWFFEAFKAAFISPFKSFTKSFKAIAGNKKGKKIGLILLCILAGLGITLVPTLIVAGLLSFDENFNKILGNFTNFLFEELAERIWALLFGIPVGMYIFGALYSSKHSQKDAVNSDSCEKFVNTLKFIPSLVGIVALLPLLCLYVIFIIAQADYFKAIFMGILPEAHTFSSFARDGFFRLCAVAVINALALILLRIFSKKNKTGKIPLSVRISTVIFSAVTIILCGTAISQMMMYVSAYGLTRLRLYTLWFMILLALLFLVAILSQFIKPLSFAAVSLTVFAVFFGLLAVPDTDALIARHNYNCYLSEKTEDFDIEYLHTLGISALPTVAKIACNDHTALSERALPILADYREFHYGYTFKNLSLPAIKAKKAYDELPQNVKDDCEALIKEYQKNREANSLYS